MNKSNFVWILDNGHGGYKNGKYVTAPSKMYKYPDGFVVHEGFFNRQVVQKIAYLLAKNGIEHRILVPEADDISLRERKERINKINEENDGRTILVSIHGNAGKGTGFEVWTSKGQTNSDTVADFFYLAMLEEFPSERMRADLTDDDFDKEKNLSILLCKGAAILTENFFMDRRADAELMKSDAGQSRIAIAHVNAVLNIESKFSKVEELDPEKNNLGNIPEQPTAGSEDTKEI